MSVVNYKYPMSVHVYAMLFIDERKYVVKKINDESTIFTVCSLKASRTETDIATATIVIKTSCSILTGVTGTG